MDDFVDDKMDVVRDTFSAQDHYFRNKIALFAGVSLFMMNCQTKLRINHLTAVKSVAILKSIANLKFYTSIKNTLYIIAH